MVLMPHAIMDPDAMVIVPGNAAATEVAVFAPRGFGEAAGFAGAGGVEEVVVFVDFEVAGDVFGGDSAGIREHCEEKEDVGGNDGWPDRVAGLKGAIVVGCRVVATQGLPITHQVINSVKYLFGIFGYAKSKNTRSPAVIRVMKNTWRQSRFPP